MVRPVPHASAHPPIQDLANRTNNGLPPVFKGVDYQPIGDELPVSRAFVKTGKSSTTTTGTIASAWRENLVPFSIGFGQRENESIFGIMRIAPIGTTSQ
jgi:hypothetical protein